MKNQVQETVEKLELKGVALLRTFTTDDTKEVREYVSVELPDPFGDVDFVDVAIRCKWDDVDAVFKYYAKKALRTTDKIEFPVTLQVLSYENTKKKKTVRYAGLIGISPFNGRELEFVVKNSDKKAVFTEIAGNLLGLARQIDDDGGDA